MSARSTRLERRSGAAGVSLSVMARGIYGAGRAAKSTAPCELRPRRLASPLRMGQRDRRREAAERVPDEVAPAEEALGAAVRPLLEQTDRGGGGARTRERPAVRDVD